MDRKRGEAVLVVRRQRSPSSRTPPSRHSARLRPSEARFRHPEPRHQERPLQGARADRRKADSRKVLIVDDELSIRLVCSINFTASGWECAEAVDGEDALERIHLEQPDVVLL